MANFRTHISFGIAFGVLGVFLLMSSALVPSSWSFFVFIWLMVTIGAILPDMDSDSGVPFHVTFGSLSLIVGGLVYIVAHKHAPQEYISVAAWVIGAIGFVWVILGSIFKRFTRHRGMAHSIPAAVLSGLCVFSLATRIGFDEWRAFLLGVALMFGYLIHLILDEIYAAVNFHGTLFLPNKALGSALKFFSKSRRINTAVYGGILFFIVGNGHELLLLCKQLLSALQ